MGDPNTFISVSFSDADSDGSGLSLSLALDTEKNTQVYGQSKTTFAPGQAAYLRLVASPYQSGYSMRSSAGSVSKSDSGITAVIDETLTFSNTKTATLSQTPASPVVWEWMGNNGGTPLFVDRNVTVNQPVVGVLHCVYPVMGDRLTLMVSAADMAGRSSLAVNVAVTLNGQTVSLTVPYESEVTDPELKTYLINATSLCAEGVISGVTVKKDGAVIGITDGLGQIEFTSFPGTYSFEASHSSYVTVTREVTLT